MIRDSSRAECAALRRRKASRPDDRASDNQARHRPETSTGCESRKASGRRFAVLLGQSSSRVEEHRRVFDRHRADFRQSLAADAYQSALPVAAASRRNRDRACSRDTSKERRARAACTSSSRASRRSRVTPSNPFRPCMIVFCCSRVNWRNGTFVGNAGLLAEAMQLLLRPLILRLGPRLDRAFLERQLGIGNHQIEIEPDRVAEALTGRARAEWIVEAEQTRLGRSVSNRASLAFEAFGECQSNGAARLRFR